MQEPGGGLVPASLQRPRHVPRLERGQVFASSQVRPHPLLPGPRQPALLMSSPSASQSPTP